jgi:hypothetical protein
MKKTFFVVHDPGGYQAVMPVIEKFINNGVTTFVFCCVGPAAILNPQFALSEDEVFNILKSLISSDQISCLVTATSWGNELEVKVIQTGKRSSIHTISILDYWSNYKQRFVLGDEYIFPDELLIMDELAHSEAIADGVPAEILKIKGQPALDHLIWVRDRIVSSSEKSNKNQLLLLSQPLSLLYNNMGYTEETVIEDCFRAMQLLPQFKLDIKFHPKDRPCLQGRYAANAVEGDLTEVLPNYDLVIGMSSIAMLHAVLLGIPTISYQPNLLVSDSSITNKLQLTPLFTTYLEFFQYLKSFSASETQSNLDAVLSKQVWGDGNSGLRIFWHIREVAAKYEH